MEGGREREQVSLQPSLTHSLPSPSLSLTCWGRLRDQKPSISTYADSNHFTLLYILKKQTILMTAVVIIIVFVMVIVSILSLVAVQVDLIVSTLSLVAVQVDY